MRARWDKRFGGGESGLTMVEVLVAAVILVLGAAASFGILGAAARNSQRAKSTQVALDLAQEELEHLQGIPYEHLGVISMPTFGSGEKNPNSRISGGLFALKRNPTENYHPIVVNEQGFSPESDFTTGDPEHGGIKGKIYRYVVWRDDPNCPETECPGEEDFKQIVVAVKPDKPVSQQGESGYVEVQSAVTDPKVEEGAEEEEVRKQEEEEREAEEGGEGSEITGQQFFLTDTPCSATGTTVRREITEDHLLHNTLGTCASGLQTGTTLGAPDALLPSAPPDPYPENEELPLLHDYSDDYYLEPTPDTDKGVQIRRDDTSGCHYTPTGTTHPESQVHRWVTDPMPHNFEMGGKVVLEFYTRTLNDALYTGRLCVYMYERKESGSGASTKAEDTSLISKPEGNPYWTYEPKGNGYWPRNSWTKVRLTMEFQEAPRTIEKGNRLLLALSVDRADTPADAIPIMYDHPNYASRLEVDTKTPLEETGSSEEAGG